VTVDLDDRGINHGIFHVWLIRSGVEKMLENAGFAPIAVTHEHTVPLTELLRKVAPRAACSRDPQHSFNEQPVITPATPRITGFAQTMWFHLRPLGVRQNESIHQKLESHQASKGNPDSQQTLAPAHHRLAAPANRLPAPAKDLAESICKNLISAIVRPAGLQRFLNGNDGGACCLRNVRLCRLFNLSWKFPNLVSPYVSPMGSRRLFSR
jgi:hypothetical protein